MPQYLLAIYQPDGGVPDAESKARTTTKLRRPTGRSPTGHGPDESLARRSVENRYVIPMGPLLIGRVGNFVIADIERQYPGNQITW